MKYKVGDKVLYAGEETIVAEILIDFDNIVIEYKNGWAANEENIEKYKLKKNKFYWNVSMNDKELIILE